ncbi:MAG: DUF4156 domain-containing protein [Gallionella sp.]
MRISKLMLVITVVLLGGLGGCTSMMIGQRAGSDRVSMANADQVAGCQSKGETIVSVVAGVGFINRREDAVEADLYQLARNNAVDAGADTLVKGASPVFGKRTYQMYKCRP